MTLMLMMQSLTSEDEDASENEEKNDESQDKDEATTDGSMR